MTANAYTVAVDDLRVTAGSIGASWGVKCWSEDCAASIVGYRNGPDAIRGGTAHLIWHINGKPTCCNCGAWLSHKSSKRCRKGTCEADQ